MPRFLHTSIFVNDINESIDFYTAKMGLKLLGGPNHHPGNADMAFVGHDWNSYIELVYDLEEHPPYELGNRYEHLALEADGDLREYVDGLRANGVKILKTSTSRRVERGPSRLWKIPTVSRSSCSSAGAATDLAID